MVARPTAGHARTMGNGVSRTQAENMLLNAAAAGDVATISTLISQYHVPVDWYVRSLLRCRMRCWMGAGRGRSENEIRMHPVAERTLMVGGGWAEPLVWIRART